MKSKTKHTLLKNCHLWDFPGSPVVKSLPSNAGGAGSISGQEAKIPHASQRKKNPKTKPMKQKQYGSKFNKEF